MQLVEKVSSTPLEHTTNYAPAGKQQNELRSSTHNLGDARRLPSNGSHTRTYIEQLLVTRRNETRIFAPPPTSIPVTAACNEHQIHVYGTIEAKKEKYLGHQSPHPWRPPTNHLKNSYISDHQQQAPSLLRLCRSPAEPPQTLPKRGPRRGENVLFLFRAPSQAQHEVQRVALLQLKVAQLLVRAAQLLPAEDDALLFRGDALLCWMHRRGEGGIQSIFKKCRAEIKLTTKQRLPEVAERKRHESVLAFSVCEEADETNVRPAWIGEH